MLKLDTEGQELAVLQGWDPGETRITHVLVECKHYNKKAVRALLAERGYLCRVFAEDYSHGQNVCLEAGEDVERSGAKARYGGEGGEGGEAENRGRERNT